MRNVLIELHGKEIQTKSALKYGKDGRRMSAKADYLV
jgi:hypothetical protein